MSEDYGSYTPQTYPYLYEFLPRKISVSKLISESSLNFYKKPILMLPSAVSYGMSAGASSLMYVSLIILLRQILKTGGVKAIIRAIKHENIAYIKETLPILQLSTIFLVWILLAIFTYSISELFKYAYVQKYLRTGVFSLRSAIETLRERWLHSFIASLTISIIPLTPLILILSTVSFGEIESIWVILLLALLIPILLLISLFIKFFVFNYIADGGTAFASLIKSYRLASQNLSTVISYGVLYFLIYLTITVIVSIFSLLGVTISTMASALQTVYVEPVFYTTKAMLYLDLRMEDRVRIKKEKVNWLRFPWKYVRRGLRSLPGFTARNTPLIAGLIMLFIASYILGAGDASLLWNQTSEFFENYTPLFEKPELLLFQKMQLAFSIFFNNWLVSIGASFSGLLIAPPILIVFFNGYIAGLIVEYVSIMREARLWPSLIPHGIIEIPVFILFNVAGIRIGYEFVKMLRSGESNLEGRIKETLYLVAGSIIPFLIAAVIETFISPRLIP